MKISELWLAMARRWHSMGHPIILAGHHEEDRSRSEVLQWGSPGKVVMGPPQVCEVVERMKARLAPAHYQGEVE